jgi:hypothetical protein
MLDDKIVMMANDKLLRVHERQKRRHVKLGDILCRGKVIGSSGVKQWYDRPTDRVVALHMDGNHFFAESLDMFGKPTGAYMVNDHDNDQWKFWQD